MIKRVSGSRISFARFTNALSQLARARGRDARRRFPATTPIARPSGQTSMSLAVKSVSVTEVDADSVTVT